MEHVLDPDGDAKPLNWRRLSPTTELAFLHVLVEQLALNNEGDVFRMPLSSGLRRERPIEAYAAQ